MTYRDTDTGEVFIPHDIETSAGVDRSLLFPTDAYNEEENVWFSNCVPEVGAFKSGCFPRGQ